MSSRLVALASALFLLSCGAPDSSATTEIAPLSDVPPFDQVQAAMGASCGSLDCHGQLGRNLRIFDERGLRLSPTTNSGEGSTTKDEIDADERSVLGLEPNLINHVFQEKGAMPERLSIVRKARGIEDHKGGSLWPEGSNGDLCFTAWLSSAVDTQACQMTVDQFSRPQ